MADSAILFLWQADFDTHSSGSWDISGVRSEEKKGFVQEFMEFLLKYQVIGLAVGFGTGFQA